MPEANNNLTAALPEGYYLENFQRLIDFVSGHYADILTEDEKEFYSRFADFSTDAKRLYVRLITRKGPYFRMDRLIYREIMNIPKAADELTEGGFLSCNPRLEPELALAVFRKDELMGLGAALKPGEQWYSILKSGKSSLVSTLLEIFEPDLWDGIESITYLVVVSNMEVVELFFLLFFGNRRQNLSDFILEDIGVLKYESYEIREMDRLFRDREVVDGMVFYYQVRDMVWIASENSQYGSIAELGRLVLNYPWPERLLQRQSRLTNHIGRLLEQCKMEEEALILYRRSTVHPSRERMARIHYSKGEYVNSMNVVNDIIRDAWNEEEMDFARQFEQRLNRKLGRPYENGRRDRFAEVEVVIERSAGEKIEKEVLNHYLEMGWEGFYRENLIWTALFGLVFWDIIFMPLPGVFFNPYQRGPSDLFIDDFCIKREVKLNERLEELSAMKDPGKWILGRYREKYNTANHLVAWKRIGEEDISRVLEWVPIDDILLIFRKMMVSLRNFRSGFPDLLLYEPEEKKYLLAEVKGPGDQLRPNQKGWLRYFDNCDLPYRVVKVKWEAGKVKK